MNIYKILVYSERNEIIFPKIELVENDYNSIQFEFHFDRDFAKKVFELKKPNGKVFVKEIIDNKITLVDYDENENIIPLINQAGTYQYEISLYESDSKLTMHKIGSFNARDEVVNINDDVVDKDARLPILDDLIKTTITTKEEVEEVGKTAKEHGDYAKEVGEQLEKDKENGLFKGEKGDKGDKGDTGEKGDTGAKGENGQDGYTPVKGVDYFDGADGQDGKDYVLTEADKQEIESNLSAKYETYLDTITPKSPPVKGELVHITDALNLPTFETTADGNAEQETTRGVQLFDISKKINKNINEIGEEVESTANSSSNYIEVEELKTYTYSFVLDYPTAIIRIHGYNANKEWISQLYTTTIGNGANHDYQVTIPKDIKYIRFTFRTGEPLATNIQFELGDKATPYEQFTNGVSPNSSYKQPIKVLEAYNLCPTDVNDWEAGSVNQSTGENMESTNRLRTKDYYPIKVDTDYYISIEDDMYRFINIVLYNNNKEYQGAYTYINSAINGATKLAINIPSKNYPNVSFMRVTVKRNDEQNLQPNEIKKIKPMMTKGSSKKTYLPYGCVGYKVNGKNLANDNEFKGTVIGTNKTIPNINVIENETYSITLSQTLNTIGTAGTNNDYKAQHNLKWLDENENVISQNNFLIMTFSSVGETKILSASYVAPTGAKYLKLDVGAYYSNGCKLIHNYIQVEKNLIATPYEPYKEQIVYLDLKGNWVGAINDSIKDYLVTDKKKYWLVKNVGKRVFNGSEEWKQSSARPSVHNILIEDFKAPLTSNTIVTNILSSHFTTGATYHQLTNNVEEFNNKITATFDNYISFKYNETTSLNAWKTWLSENNVELYYQLKEPQIIELGELPEPIKTFEGVNNIQLLANLDTEIEVKYALDVKKYFDNKLAEISAQII